MTELFFVKGGPSDRTGSLPAILFAAAVIRNGPDHPEEPNVSGQVLVFSSDSRDWMFLDSQRNTDLIIDSTHRLHLGPASHRGRVSGTSVVGVAETMEVSIDSEQLRRISEANSVEIQLGGVQVALRPSHISAIKELIRRSGGI